MERAHILERTKRGKVGKARNGEVVLAKTVPYGYRKATTPHPTDPRRTISTLEIERTLSDLVRQVFAWYLAGRSVYSIARELTASGVPTNCTISTNRTGTWHPSSIDNMLKNETVAARWHWGKRNYERVGHNAASNRAMPAPGRSRTRSGGSR